MRIPFATLALVSAASCAGPMRADRTQLSFTGEPFDVRHSDAVAQPRSASSGAHGYGGRITGQICGMDVVYEVELEGDHLKLTGWLDGSLPTELEVRDRGGERQITGYLGSRAGASAVDLHLRGGELDGRVGFRYFHLGQLDDQLVGPLRIAGTQSTTTATIHGNGALWSMPAADQGAVVPSLLSCYLARIGGYYDREPLIVSIGGKAGAYPHRSSSIYEKY